MRKTPIGQVVPDQRSGTASPTTVGISLEELEKLLRRPCLVVDARGRVVDISATAAQLLGSTAGAIRDQEIVDLLVPPRQTAKHLHGQKRQDCWTDGVTLRSQDGARVYVTLRTVPVELSTGKGKLCILGQRAEMQSSADEPSKVLHSLQQFVTASTHELKSPISTILGHVDSLRAAIVGGGDDPSAVRSLSAIERQCARLQRLLEDLNRASREMPERMELRRERIDLGALVERVVRDAGTTSRRHRFLLQTKSPAIVEADPTRIEQVLVNLLSNAVKYSPDGGEIRVQVRMRAQEAAVSVSDNGIGIPRTRRADLFKPYSRLHVSHEEAGGIGLGLYLSRTFIVQHGGRMEVRSKEGQGSTFRFSLPLAPQEHH